MTMTTTLRESCLAGNTETFRNDVLQNSETIVCASGVTAARVGYGEKAIGETAHVNLGQNMAAFMQMGVSRG